MAKGKIEKAEAPLRANGRQISKHDKYPYEAGVSHGFTVSIFFYQRLHNQR